jgi:Na+-driven multidrug efflux pump
MLVTLITALLSPFINWLLIHKAEMGFHGGGLAFLVSNLLKLILHVGYVYSESFMLTHGVGGPENVRKTGVSTWDLAFQLLGSSVVSGGLWRS